jgi:hypothetical protein
MRYCPPDDVDVALPNAKLAPLATPANDKPEFGSLLISLLVPQVSSSMM